MGTPSGGAARPSAAEVAARREARAEAEALCGAGRAGVEYDGGVVSGGWGPDNRQEAPGGCEASCKVCCEALLSSVVAGLAFS